MTIDEKWERVKAWYEPSYKVKFKARLKDADIELLFSNMMKFRKTIDEYYDRGRPAVSKIIEFNPSN